MALLLEIKDMCGLSLMLRGILRKKSRSLRHGQLRFTTERYIGGKSLDKSLQTLSIKVCNLPTINPEDLTKLGICERLVDIDAPVGQEDVQPDAAPQQAPQIPHASVAAPRTIT
nr:hypothetical protein [Tanacetum cinerariifolium]